jgi:hypothetical protein
MLHGERKLQHLWFLREDESVLRSDEGTLRLRADDRIVVWAGFPNDPPEARASPPLPVTRTSQEPGFFDRFVDWLVLMARVSPPLP